MKRSAKLAMPVLLAATTFAASVFEEGSAAERFRKLTSREIQNKIIGRMITDEAHWSQDFRRDGRLISSDMGKRSEGRWRISGDKLCLWNRFLDGECYEVWIAGDEVDLRAEGIESPATAYIRDSRP